MSDSLLLECVQVLGSTDRAWEDMNLLLLGCNMGIYPSLCTCLSNSHMKGLLWDKTNVVLHAS